MRAKVELRRAVDCLPADQLPAALAVVGRLCEDQTDDTWPPPWFGSITSGRTNVAASAKDVLRAEFGAPRRTTPRPVAAGFQSAGHDRPVDALACLGRVPDVVHTGVVTTRERLHALVDRLGDEDADRALALLEATVGTNGDFSPLPRRRRPRSLGIGASGRHDVSENVDAVLAEGFGRSRPAT